MARPRASTKVVDTRAAPRPRTARPVGFLVLATVAGAELGVSAKTIRAWVDSGEVDGEYLGGRYYMTRPALDALLRKRNAPESDDSGASP